MLRRPVAARRKFHIHRFDFLAISFFNFFAYFLVVSEMCVDGEWREAAGSVFPKLAVWPRDKRDHPQS